MAEMVNIYRFKVSLLDVPINQLHRVIELAGNAPFSVLHDMIFLAFDRYDPHLYKFLLTYREVKSQRALFDCKEMVEDTDMVEPSPWAEEDEIRHDAYDFTLDDAKLKEKDFFYYWFDFGDDWLHRIRVEKISRVERDWPEGVFYSSLVKSVGESPPQYGEDSVWTSDTPEALGEKMMALLATLATCEEGTLLWETAMGLGVAEALLSCGLVDAIGKPDEAIVLNEQGQQQMQILARLMQDNPAHEK